MTEAEWLACEKPEPMLIYFERRFSTRKLRLFAVACCRRVLPLAPTSRNRDGLEVAERFADGMAGETDLKATFDASLVRGSHIRTSWALLPDAFRAATSAAHHISHAVSMQKPPKRRLEAHIGENVIQAILARDIFGNPFRAVTYDPTWLTSDVIAMCRSMYDSRDFSAMPILADALQDAGCDSEDVLNHRRGPGPHVRGCWVIDLVLDKE
jgi:hypothetical protein